MLIIDRFEDEYAICECSDGNLMQIRRDLIAADAREGDVLIPGQNTYTVDTAATLKRRRRIRQKADRLFSKGHS